MKQINSSIGIIILSTCFLVVMPFLVDCEETPRPTAAQEQQEIAMLATYSLVLSDWQSDSVPWQQRRGYNIGALLISPENQIVASALNAVTQTEDATQHAEVRVIQKFLAQTNENFDLKRYTLVTTLDPCVMCAGMSIMTQVERVIYGQSDWQFGEVYPRLASTADGLPSYPRLPERIKDHSPISKQLDQAFQEVRERDDQPILGAFLASDEAKSIFLQAPGSLHGYALRHESNRALLEQAREIARKSR